MSSDESRGGGSLKFCWNCGAPLVEGVKFCSSCGVDAVPTASSASRRVETRTTRGSSTDQRVRMVKASILVVAVLFFFLPFYAASSGLGWGVSLSGFKALEVGAAESYILMVVLGLLVFSLASCLVQGGGGRVLGVYLGGVLTLAVVLPFSFAFDQQVRPGAGFWLELVIVVVFFGYSVYAFREYAQEQRHTMAEASLAGRDTYPSITRVPPFRAAAAIGGALALVVFVIIVIDGGGIAALYFAAIVFVVGSGIVYGCTWYLYRRRQRVSGAEHPPLSFRAAAWMGGMPALVLLVGYFIGAYVIQWAGIAVVVLSGLAYGSWYLSRRRKRPSEVKRHASFSTRMSGNRAKKPAPDAARWRSSPLVSEGVPTVSLDALYGRARSPDVEGDSWSAGEGTPTRVEPSVSSEPVSRPASPTFQSPEFSRSRTSFSTRQARRSRRRRLWLLTAVVVVVIVAVVVPTVALRAGGSVSPEAYAQQMQEWMRVHSPAMNSSQLGYLVDPAELASIDASQLLVLKTDNARLHQALDALKRVRPLSGAEYDHNGLVQGFGDMVKAYDLIISGIEKRDLSRFTEAMILKNTGQEQVNRSLSSLSAFFYQTPQGTELVETTTTSIRAVTTTRVSSSTATSETSATTSTSETAGDAVFAIMKGGKYVLVDRAGKQLSAENYDLMGEPSEGLVAVARGGKMGYLDSKGHLAIKLQFGTKLVPAQSDYEEALYPTDPSFSEGLAAVYLNGKVGFIDTTGRFVVKAFCDDALAFSGGLAAVKTGEEWGFIDPTGTQVIPCKYQEVGSFSGGLALFYDGEHKRYGFVDATGKEVLTGYDSAGSFSEGLATVEQDGKWGYIDTSGSFVIPPSYYFAQPFSEGLAAVTKEYDLMKGNEDTVGYINRKGETVIEFQFAEAGPFSEGLAAVRWEVGGRIANVQGYIDTSGREIIPPQFNYGRGFRNGLARVFADGSPLGYVDKIGNLVIRDQ